MRGGQNPSPPSPGMERVNTIGTLSFVTDDVCNMVSESWRKFVHVLSVFEAYFRLSRFSGSYYVFHVCPGFQGTYDDSNT